MNILGNLHVVAGLVPLDVGAAGTEIFTDVLDVGEYAELEFILACGAITTDDTVIKLYSDANTTTGGGTAIAFKYKQSAALGTDTSGAWTSIASTGLTLTATTDTNKTLRVNVDPQLCEGLPYVYLGIDPGESQTVGLYSVVAVGVPTYSQSIPPSTVN